MFDFIDPIWLNTLIVSFTTFFALVGPVETAGMFAGLTVSNTPAERRAQAIKGACFATIILLVFALFGNALLSYMGITLPALRTAGGILLLLMAIDLVFSRHSGATTTTDDENIEARAKTDISVFPLATPLLAGPGAIGAAILLTADTTGDVTQMSAVITALIAVQVVALVLLLAATQVHRILGVTGLNVVSRVMGILLAALAVQFIFDGISRSGLF